MMQSKQGIAWVAWTAGLMGWVFFLTGVCAQDGGGGRPDREKTAAEEAAIEARSSVLILGRLLGACGFISRESYWLGKIGPGASVIVPVHLYRGNDYYFLAGAGSKSAVKLTLLDSSGNPIDGDAASGHGRSVVGVSVKSSGGYFLRVEAGPGKEKSYCCVSYAYR